MRKLFLSLVVILVLSAGCATTGNGENGSSGAGAPERLGPPRKEPARLADPIEPVNRAFFQFNDVFYLWVLEPVAEGYAVVVPATGRRGIDNFFTNLGFPGRFVNCILQADLYGSGVETARFCTNTTVGVLGFGNPATHWLGLKPRREDFAQTFAVYGVGAGFYINWPLMGPSSVRGTVGSLLDSFLYAPSYVYGLTLYERINSTSLHLGRYGELKEAALDPYIGLKNAYWQRRQKLISE